MSNPGVSALLLLLLLEGSPAQKTTDACHVHVVDLVKSNRALGKLSRTDDEKAEARALSAGKTIFPEFRPP